MADAPQNAASWTNYWQAQVRDAFAASEAEDEALQALWHAWFLDWRPGDRVLDVGCGNGALAHTLGNFADAHRRSFSYVGIDQAALSDIKRPSFEYLQTELAGGMPAETAAFPVASFDRVVSQFGFEYCDVATVAEKIHGWLADGGTVSMLLHTRDSALSSEVRYTLEQMRMAEESALLIAVARLLSRLDEVGGPAHTDPTSVNLRELINHTCRELETKAAGLPNPVFLKRFVSLCLGVFDARRAQIPPSIRLANLTLLSTELIHHKARLEQQQRVALDEAGLTRLGNLLAAQGFRCSRSEVFSFDKVKIGFVVAAERV